MNWFEHIRSVTGKCSCNKKKLNASHMGTFICITFVIMILVLYQILTVWLRFFKLDSFDFLDEIFLE